MRDTDDLHIKYFGMEKMGIFIRSVFALFQWHVFA
jgi:hypothetical protein